MEIAKWITGVLLIIGFGGSGMAKITAQAAMKQAAEHLNVPWERMRMLGFLEVAGAVGIVLGLVWADLAPLAIAAAVGLALVGIGGAIVHARADDRLKDFAPAAVLGLIAIAFIVIMGGSL